jgi:hypothetical protein
MDKGRRNQLRQLHYKKRLKNLGLKETEKDVNLHCFKDQGKPCSCLLCSPEKYNRKEKHKNKDIEEENLFDNGGND